MFHQTPVFFISRFVFGRLSAISITLLCLLWTMPVQADDPPPAHADAASLAACLTTCAAKTYTVSCVSLDDFKHCLRTVPDCQGVMSDGERTALGTFCQACGEAAPACAPQAPAPASGATAPTVSPQAQQRPLTPAQQCRRKGGLWVKEEILNNAGTPTGEVQERCFTLAAAHQWLQDLERGARMQRAGTGTFTPEDTQRLRNLLQSDLPLHLKQRLEQMEAGMAVLCPTDERRPQASIRERCFNLRRQVESNTSNIQFVEAKTDTAMKVADRAHVRLNEIVTGRKPLPAYGSMRPHLRFSAVVSVHAIPDDGHNRITGGLEMEWLPNITPDLWLAILAGGGPATRTGGETTFALWSGFGWAGPVKTENVVIEGLGYLEQWFGSEPELQVNFFGFSPGITYYAGAKDRKDYLPIPAIGFRCPFGSEGMPDAQGRMHRRFNFLPTGYLLFAF